VRVYAKIRGFERLIIESGGVYLLLNSLEWFMGLNA